MKTFVSPGSWFSFQYPDSWCEFEEQSDGFLFYDPDEWKGNFRIQAWRDVRKSYGKACVDDEVRNGGARLTQVGTWQAAKSEESFVEEGLAYTNHYWLVGFENTCVECTYTVQKGFPCSLGEQLVASLKINSIDAFFSDCLIPVRLAEMTEIDNACSQLERIAKKAYKLQFKDFNQSLEVLQRLVDGNELKQFGAEANVMLGLAVCALVAENVDGYEWRTYINRKEEKPVLVKDNILSADPHALFAPSLSSANVSNAVEKILLSAKKKD